VTCVHVGVFPPTHNWAKILENCQAKKRPRLIQKYISMYTVGWAQTGALTTVRGTKGGE
jgi:hypothetical protein